MAAGADEVTVTVNDSPTAGDIVAALLEQHPALGFALVPSARPRLAVNHAFAEPQMQVRAGDEVALITLVGGG